MSDELLISPKRKWSPLVVIFALSGVFFVLFVLISSLVFFSKSSTSWRSADKTALFGSSEGVGIIELKGVILDSKKIIRVLKHFEEDKRVKSIVLRLNSPGGAVAPSQEIYEAVRHFPKPVVASMASVAASGAYYVACGTKKVFANAGTLTGSIGVIMEFANLRKLYEWAKIERFSVKTGKFKDTGSEFRDMTPEERQFLQNLVDDVLVQFKEAVATGRRLSLETVTSVADGRIFTGAQAKKLKLVDEIGTLQDAVNEAAREGKIQGKPKWIYPEENKSRILDLLMDNHDEDDSEAESGFAGLLSLVINRLFATPLNTNHARWAGPLLEPGIYWLWNGVR